MFRICGAEKVERRGVSKGKNVCALRPTEGPSESLWFRTCCVHVEVLWRWGKNQQKEVVLTILVLIQG